MPNFVASCRAGIFAAATQYLIIMNVLDQILFELGADTLKAFTVIPAFGGYFKSVKSVKEYSPEKIILILHKSALILQGEKLEIGKYFEQDIFIKGNIKVINVE